MAKHEKAAAGNRQSRLPYSGPIIAALLQAFDLEITSPDPRTVRRYLSGKSITEDNEADFFLSLGEKLVEQGVVPVPVVFEYHGVSTDKVTGVAFARAARKWDQLVATLQSHSTPNLDLQNAVAGFLRVVIVDLAIRVFAVVRLCKTSPPSEKSPSWAAESGGGLLLRRLLADSGLTRRQLAEEMGVSDTSVDNWCDGQSKPSRKNISLLGACLSHRTASQSSFFEQQLQLQFGLAEISDRLATLIGRNAVIDLASALYELVRLMTADANRVSRPPLEETARAEFDFLTRGVDAPDAPTLLRNIELDVAEPEWRSALQAAAYDWKTVFQEIALQAAGSNTSAGLAQELRSLPSLSEEQYAAEAAAMLEFRQAFPFGLLFERRGVSHLLDYIDSQIALRRRITERHPLSAFAHFQLGSYLGMAAKSLWAPAFLEDGIRECKIASALIPGWDAPAVEPAIMLGNSGLYARALVELDWAKSVLPEPTPHFRYCQGYVLMCLGRYQEALEAFEQVLAAAPTYALALDDAARCAFEVGNGVKGRQYAKRARRAGIGDTYFKWKNGEYSERRKHTR